MLAQLIIFIVFAAAAYGIYYFGYQLYCIFARIPLSKPFKFSAGNSDNPPFGNVLARVKRPQPNAPSGAEAKVTESNTCSQIP